MDRAAGRRLSPPPKQVPLRAAAEALPPFDVFRAARRSAAAAHTPIINSRNDMNSCPDQGQERLEDSAPGTMTTADRAFRLSLKFFQFAASVYLIFCLYHTGPHWILLVACLAVPIYGVYLMMKSPEQTLRHPVPYVRYKAMTRSKSWHRVDLAICTTMAVVCAGFALVLLFGYFKVSTATSYYLQAGVASLLLAVLYSVNALAVVRQLQAGTVDLFHSEKTTSPFATLTSLKGPLALDTGHGRGSYGASPHSVGNAEEHIETVHAVRAEVIEEETVYTGPSLLERLRKEAEEQQRARWKSPERHSPRKWSASPQKSGWNDWQASHERSPIRQTPSSAGEEQLKGMSWYESNDASGRRQQFGNAAQWSSMESSKKESGDETFGFGHSEPATARISDSVREQPHFAVRSTESVPRIGTGKDPLKPAPLVTARRQAGYSQDIDKIEDFNEKFRQSLSNATGRGLTVDMDIKRQQAQPQLRIRKPVMLPSLRQQLHAESSSTIPQASPSKQSTQGYPQPEHWHDDAKDCDSISPIANRSYHRFEDDREPPTAALRYRDPSYPTGSLSPYSLRHSDTTSDDSHNRIGQAVHYDQNVSEGSHDSRKTLGESPPLPSHPPPPLETARHSAFAHFRSDDAYRAVPARTGTPNEGDDVVRVVPSTSYDYAKICTTEAVSPSRRVVPPPQVLSAVHRGSPPPPIKVPSSEDEAAHFSKPGSSQGSTVPLDEFIESPGYVTRYETRRVSTTVVNVNPDEPYSPAGHAHKSGFSPSRGGQLKEFDVSIRPRTILYADSADLGRDYSTSSQRITEF